MINPARKSSQLNRREALQTIGATVALAAASRGGRLIDAPLPLHLVPLGAAAMALVAIAIAGFSIALEQRGLRAIQPAPCVDQSLSALARLQCRVR